MILKKRIFDVTCSVVLLISLMIIAAGVTSYADMIKKEDITNLEQELESIKKRQEATEKELAEIEKDENYVESSIAYSEELIKGYTEYVKLLSNIIAGYDEAIEDTEEQIEILRVKYDDVYRVYLIRLRASREQDAYSLLELIFSSESLTELIEAAERVADTIDYDKRVIVKLEKQKKELAAELENLEVLRQGQQEQIDGYEVLKTTVKERVDELNDRLVELKNKKDEVEEQISIDSVLAKEADEALEKLLAAYEKQLETTAEYADGEKMIWPINKKWNYISSYFGYRVHPIYGTLDGHKGIDIPANGGENIYAALSGVVVTSVYSTSYGYYIMVDHGLYGKTGKRLYTLYSHCSKLLVKKGDKVTQGQVIARVGTTGLSTGNHLHFEVRLGDVRQDPLDYVTRPK